LFYVLNGVEIIVEFLRLNTMSAESNSEEINHILGHFQSGVSITTLAVKYRLSIGIVERIIRNELIRRNGHSKKP
jgi:Mor family transcriptional regulator